jgi:phosphomannomutase
LTKKERQETQKLTPAERNVFFANESLHFGTAGVRGKMGLGTTRMNRFTYTNLAQAYARYIVDEYGINKTVIIGHDNRLHSTTFAKLVAKVLSAFKINAVLFPNNHLIPTPIVSYAIRVTKAVGGIIITASHNPKTYNGFKAYHNDGSQVLPNVVKKIDKKLIKPADILDITYQPQLGLISYLNKSIINRYFKDAQQVLIDNKKLQKKDKNFPVVLTAHHGTACKLLPKFLHTLGFNIKPVTAQMFYSPTFVNSPISNPEDINSFALAIKLAEKIGSLICIGVDPDADRMAICIKHQNK